MAQPNKICTQIWHDITRVVELQKRFKDLFEAFPSVNEIQFSLEAFPNPASKTIQDGQKHQALEWTFFLTHPNEMNAVKIPELGELTFIWLPSYVQQYQFYANKNTGEGGFQIYCDK